MVRVDNEHAKLSCAPPNQYKAMLCNTKVYIATELVHDGRWYTKQVDGAQCSPVPTKWCTM